MNTTSYAISAGHERTLEAADEILCAGGNALDAAVAAYAMTWVAEPCMSAAAGGGFASIFDPKRGCRVLDFFCQTPRRRRPIDEIDFFPIEVDFGDVREVFHVGQGSVAVPGAIAGLYALHAQGARMPMRELLQPAVTAAREGVQVNAFQRLDFQLLEPILRISDLAAPLFFREGQLIEQDATMQMPGMADFLDYLWREGPQAFYRGEIAAKICREQEHQGGFLCREDFESYAVIQREALHFQYRGHSIWTNPAPAMGGTILQYIFEQMEQLQTFSPPRTEAAVQQLAEVFEAAARRGISASSPPRYGSTTHFNILDSEGMAVSLTASNGEGSGVFVPHTDIQLNNMLGESALLPGGFHSWQPNRRMASMMSPTLVTNKLGDVLEGVLGSGGAGRIPYAIAQVLHYRIDCQYPLEAAVQAARMHLHEAIVELEPGLPPLTSTNRWQSRAWAAPSLFFGGVHSLWQERGNMEAAGDQRRDGVSKVQREKK